MVRLAIPAVALLSGVASVRAFSGAMSWYVAETGNAGACGNMLSNSGWTVALNYVQWDGGAHCGKQITIQYGGRTQTATVADQCMSCGGYGGIDLTPGLADAFGMRDSGIVQATWNFGSGQQQQASSSSSQRPWSSSSTSSSNTWRPSSSSSTWTPSSSSSRSSSSSSHSSSSSPTSTWSSSTSSSSSSSSSSITSSNSTSLASTSAGNSTAAATSSISANSTAVASPSAASAQGGSLSQVNRFVIQMANVVLQAAETAAGAQSA